MSTSLQVRLSRFQFRFLIAGVVAFCLTVLGAFFDRRQFFFSYLFGYLFWLGLSLGCFLVTMIHELTGGRWGYPTRRFLEAGFMVLPLMVVLFIPILFGLHNLYPWARPAEVAADKVLRGRQIYQNGWGYVLRTFFFLGVWLWMASCLRRWSLQQDATADPGPTRRARVLSGPGLVIYGLLGTFACLDWIMSLEKHWYSTLFALIILAGQVLVAYAFAVVMLTLFKGEEPLGHVVTKTHYHHLGNLLLAFVLFWTYVSFGQLLIIYSADLPHEIDWYLHRIAASWKAVVAALALFHFFVPFFLLLFRGIKKHALALSVLAAMILAMHLVNTYWLVMPSLHSEGIVLSWQDLTAPIGIGGLWLAFFLSRLRAAPLLPQQDPGSLFALAHEH